MSTSGSILTAEAIQIVKVNEEAHTFRLSEEDVTQLILQENVKNRDVVIVSVAGAFRKGKSFLLDFFLRYLYAKVSYQIIYSIIFNKLIFLVCSSKHGCMVGQRR